MGVQIMDGLGKLSSLVEGKKKMAIVLCILGFGLLVGGFAYTGKIHNPFEHIAEEIIKEETGVDIDKILPPDAPDSSVK